MHMIDADVLLKELPVHPDRGMRSVKEEGLMIRVRETIRNAPTVGEWISVKDRLPETGKLALVYGSCGAMTVARHITRNDWIVPGMFPHVTHWMPLPEPPKEET